MTIHDDLREIITRIQTLGWDAQIEPDIGGRRPDLVITKPGGPTWIVELKHRGIPLHMADLGQVVSFREAWIKEHPEVGPVGGEAAEQPMVRVAILTDEEDPTEFFKASAQELDVELFTQRKRGAELAEAFVSHLQQSAC